MANFLPFHGMDSLLHNARFLPAQGVLSHLQNLHSLRIPSVEYSISFLPLSVLLVWRRLCTVYAKHVTPSHKNAPPLPRFLKSFCQGAMQINRPIQFRLQICICWRQDKIYGLGEYKMTLFFFCWGEVAVFILLGSVLCIWVSLLTDALCHWLNVSD